MKVGNSFEKWQLGKTLFKILYQMLIGAILIRSRGTRKNKYGEYFKLLIKIKYKPTVIPETWLSNPTK